MAFYGASFLKEPSSDNCRSREHCSSVATLTFIANKAHKHGGALFVEDSDYTAAWHSELHGYDISCLPFYCEVTEQIEMTLQFIFSQNFATIAGNDIFGGWIDFYRLSEKLHITTIFEHYENHDQLPPIQPVFACVRTQFHYVTLLNI